MSIQNNSNDCYVDKIILDESHTYSNNKNNQNNQNNQNHQTKKLQQNLNISFLTTAIYINQYDTNNIFLLEPIKNSIIERSKFIKIVYSDKNMMMNGISIYLSFNDIIHIFDANNNILTNNYRYKIFIDKNKNKETINFIKSIEYDIFNKLINNKKYQNKIFNYKLNEQINSNFIKCTNDNLLNYNTNLINNNRFILKISGICETEYEINLTYKFIEINKDNILI